MNNASRKAYFVRYSKAHLSVENALYSRVLAWCAAQQNRVITTFESQGADAATRQINETFKGDELKEIFFEDYAKGGAAFRAFVLKNFERTNVEKSGILDSMLSVSIAVARFQSVMSTFAESMAAQRVTGICENLRNLLRNVVEAAIGQNLSKAETSKEIRKNWKAASKSRARLIARTETTTIAGFAQMETAKEFSIELDKVWISARDGRTRPDHKASDGQRVKYDDDFTINGVKMKQPGDPRGGAKNCCNCRCTVAFVPAKNYGPLR